MLVNKLAAASGAEAGRTAAPSCGPRMRGISHMCGWIAGSLLWMDLREWVKVVQVFPAPTNEFLPGDYATVNLTLQPPLHPPTTAA